MDKENIRNELLSIGFSESVVSELTDAARTADKQREDWDRMRQLMRDLGWDEEKIEAHIQQLTYVISIAVDDAFDALDPGESC